MLLDGPPCLPQHNKHSRLDRDCDNIEELKIPAPNDLSQFALIDDEEEDEVHAAQEELMKAE